MNLLFTVWGICTILFIALLVAVKMHRGQSIPPLEEVVDLAFGVGSTIVGFQLLCQAFTLQKVQECLGWDGLIAFAVGGGCAVWVGIKLIHGKFAIKTN